MPSNMGGGRDRLETPRRRTKLVRRAKCEAKRNFLTDEDKQEFGRAGPGTPGGGY